MIDTKNFFPKTSKNRYLYAVVLVVAASLAGHLMRNLFSNTNLVMFYILAVVVAALKLGRGPSILAAVLGVLFFDFLFVHPYYSFAVADTEYLVTFLVLFIVGIVISTLVEDTRHVGLMKEKDKMQTALFNSISHDLRTPIASITGALSTLIENPELDAVFQKELLETASEEAGRMNQLVGNLLDMARVEAGALKISSKLCEVRDVVGSALNQFEEKLRNKNITIKIPAELPDVLMDFSLMMKVLVNLIDNAVNYSPAGVELEIEASYRNLYVELRISDRGLGIPQEDIEHVFDKFYRVKRPQSFKGTGLGLSICRSIVEAHKGRIRAENRSGGGTSIVILLPCQK